MDNNLTFVTRRIVRKKASNGKEKLSDEIHWLASLPENVKHHFPDVLESHINETNAYYEMPFYNIPTLRQAIFERIVNGEIACNILDVIFDFMYTNFYSKSQQKVPFDFLKKVHFNRVLERIKQVKNKAEIFNKIISKTYILWDEKRYQNPLFLIDLFESENKLIELLSPTWICQVHGDLHFDNILVDISDSKVLNNFILIDPRGWSQGSDYGYDLGKLWHSFHGLYDFIHKGYFSISYNEISDKEIKVDIKYENSNILKEYRFIFDKFPNILTEKYKLSDVDPHWNLRTLFTEAMHFISLPDFHLAYDGKEQKAVSLYMIGVKLLNDVWDEYVLNFR